eukprot:8626109-Alexandrium_andersonii.AAC.1
MSDISVADVQMCKSERDWYEFWLFVLNHAEKAKPDGGSKALTDALKIAEDKFLARRNKTDATAQADATTGIDPTSSAAP